jgi:phosphate/sulfate permease
MAWNIGANDVANAMGTSVGSGALTLKQAVLVAAILEFSGAFFFGSHVSDTIQKGIVDSSIFSKDPLTLVYGMLASLMAAGVWLQVASYYGWPVSTTHSIVGSIVGFGWIVGGWEAVYWDNVAFIVSSWVISPLMGGVISYLIFTILRKKIFYTSNPVESAKKLTPILVFIVLTILSLIMVFKGLQNLNLNLSFFEAALVSAGTGLIGALISFFCVRTIEPSVRSQTQKRYNPETALSLEKAKKHLEQVKSNASGEIEYETSIILEGINNLSESLKKTVDIEVNKSEYAIVEKIFGYLQIISACLMAFAHGANDVANAIGPLSASITVLNTRTIISESSVPIWALALGGFGIVVGLATWGWRVIETIGKKITELTPTRGFAAEFGAAATVVIASRCGLPISTTHTLVGSVIGVGLARGIEALDLTMTRDIVISWLVTVPAGACIAVSFFYIIQAIFG